MDIRLPNWEGAFVAIEKLDFYLLSESHPIGRSKARLLRNLGYATAGQGVLRQDLISIARDQNVSEVVTSEYGSKFVIDGVLHTPSGVDLAVRTIWIIETGEDRPRFVTAYPV